MWPDTSLPPRYEQWFEVEFSTHVPLTEREAKVINLAIQRALESVSVESPLRDTGFNPGSFTKAKPIKKEST